MNFQKIIKYIVCGTTIFLTLKYVINNKMPILDVALVAIIMMLIFAVVEHASTLITNDNDNTNTKNPTISQCQSFCAMKEHMENTNTTNNTTNNNTTNTNNINKVMSEDYDKFQKQLEETTEQNTQHNKDYINKTGLIDRNDDGSYQVNFQRKNDGITSIGSRSSDDVSKETDMKYTSYHTLPPNLNTGTFEFGYSFLPPPQWYPTPPFPPVCVAEKQCPVCPVSSSSDFVNLKEWDSTRKISPPDEINVKYVEEKLNAGK